MAPNRGSSPSSLLWAHQLKREHGFLLDRMKKLETAISRVESTASGASKAVTNIDIAAIAAQVRLLCEDGGNKAVENVRPEMMKRFEDVSARMEAIVLKVAAIEKTGDKLEDDRRQAFNNEKAMLKRVKEVEENVKKYEEKLEEVGSRIEESMIDQIREHLKRVTGQVESNGASIDTVNATLHALEAAAAELQKGSDVLAKKLKHLACRTPPAPIVIQAAPAAAAPPPPPASTLPHGATQEPAAPTLIRAAENPAQDQPIEKRPRPQRKARAALKAKAAKESTVPDASSKSKVVVETLASQRTPRKRVKKDTAEVKEEQPIIRAGRGWIEVAYMPNNQETAAPNAVIDAPTRGRGRPRETAPVQSIEAEPVQTVGPSVKRGRRRPRKDDVQPAQPIRNDPARSKRTIKQPDETQNAVLVSAPATRGTKRKAAALANTVETQAPPPPSARSTRNRAAKMKDPANVVEGAAVLHDKSDAAMVPCTPPMKTKKNLRRGLTSVFTSPISSPPTLADESETRLAIGLPASDAQDPPAMKKKRRTIEQMEEE